MKGGPNLRQNFVVVDQNLYVGAVYIRRAVRECSPERVCYVMGGQSFISPLRSPFCMPETEVFAPQQLGAAVRWAADGPGGPNTLFVISDLAYARYCLRNHSVDEAALQRLVEDPVAWRVFSAATPATFQALPTWLKDACLPFVPPAGGPSRA